MAPTTRSHVAKSKNSVTVPPPAPVPAPAKGIRRGKSKPAQKKPAATTRPTAKVQKRQSAKKKGKKPASIASPKASPRASSKVSSKPPSGAPSKASPKPSPEVSPRVAFKSPFKKAPRSKPPKAPANYHEQDDFPELALAYDILPYLDSPDFAPPYARSKSSPRNIMNAFEATSSPPPPSAARPSMQDPLIIGDYNPSLHIGAAPGMHPRRSFGSDSIRRPSLSNGTESEQGAHVKDLDRIIAEIQQDAAAFYRTETRDAKAQGKKHKTSGRKKRPSSVLRGMIRQTNDQSSSSAPSPVHGRRASSTIRNIVAQVDEQSPETPVSIHNAQVFKRPTVADMRRERKQMYDQLDGWVARLKRARDDFDGVIEEVEVRMDVLKAVNRVQAPLRNAPLGRGH